MAKYTWSTTSDFITNGKLPQASVKDILETEGFTTEGDGGSAQWELTATTGAASQTPAQLGNALLNDASGNQWKKVYKNTYNSLGIYPLPKDGTSYKRIVERIFTGSAALDAAGTDNKLDGTTFIGDPAQAVNSHYLELGAQNLNVNYYGGIGITSGARSLDRYEYKGCLGVWAAGISVTAGDKYGYNSKIYVADSTGTTGTTELTHSTGSVSDGLINWTYDGPVEGTTIADAAVLLQNVIDGRGAWARYTEAVRSPEGGTAFAEEIAVKNKGSDVVSNPYNHLASNSTIGQWFAGGGDPFLNGGVPTNPSTAAIVIGKNGDTWNTGIIFAADGITGTDGVSGAGNAISMGKGHQLSWFTTDGVNSSNIKSQVSNSSQKVGIEFVNGAVRTKGNSGEITSEIQNVNSSINYLRVTPSTTSNPVTLRTVGSDTNIDLKLQTQGTGDVLINEDLAYHAGNTNLNVFGAGGARNIATGVALNATTALFYLPINSYELPTGITLSEGATFEIRSVLNASLVTGITAFTFDSASSNRLVRLTVSGLTGLTANQPIELKQQVASSTITVNY